MAETGAQTGEAAATALTTWVEHAATGIELLAVVSIVAVILVATILYVSQFLARRADAITYRDYRQQVARALLLGLEVLVAADIVRTVALEPTLQHRRHLQMLRAQGASIPNSLAMVLALLVVVLGFLGLFVVLFRQ